MSQKVSYIFPSNLLTENSRYGNTSCSISILETYNNNLGESNNSVKNVEGDKQNQSYIDSLNQGYSPRNILNKDIKRIAATIHLPMPLSFNTNYGVIYDDSFSYVEEGKQLIGALAGSSANATDFALKKLGSYGPALGKLIQDTAKPALKITGAGSGLALNPHKELLFTGVKFREFKFKYKLIAKNEKESEQILNITKLFEKHMHPTLEAGSLLYRYPSEFEIKFLVNNGSNNKFVFKLYKCVLQNFNVLYGGNNFTTFKNLSGTTNGAPVEIEIELDFKETNVLTQDFIDNVLRKDN